MEGLKSPDWQARNAAILRLSVLGDRARPAIPDLIAAIDRETTGLSVALALKRIAPESAESALIGLLKDPTACPGARAGAAGGLRQIEAASAPALEAITEAIADPDKNVQSAVRSALLTLAGLRPEAIPNIIGKLKDPSPVARQNAAHVLGRLRWGEEPPSEARAIAPALAEALKDPEAPVRREAAEALYF